MFNNSRLADFIFDPEKDCLGHGKHGYVYKVKNRKDNKIYALKIVKQNPSDPDQAKNISREYHIMSNINHPNLEKIYGGFQEYYPIDNQYCIFFILEFIKGDNLTDFLEKYKKEKKNIEQKLIIKILKGIAEGLGYLHKNGILHRDITPDNIMIEDNRKNIKITDFGISAYYKQYNQPQLNKDPLFYNQSIVGRNDFVCPEIFDAYKKNINPIYDFKADIYSLGITMFKLMTFCYPISLKNRDISINYADKIDPKIYNQNLINIVIMMLQEDPNKRPTCEEIYYSLEFIDTQINSNNQNIIRKDIKISKKSCFVCVINCLRNIKQIYNYLVENIRNKNNKKLISEKSFSVIKAFIKVLEESKEKNNLSNDFICEFIDAASQKIILIKEEENITPKILIQSLFNYFLEILPNIFVYNNIKGHELSESIQNEKDANSFYIEQKIEKYKEKYKNIFVTTFYFLVQIKYKCPECNFIIKNDINIEFDIDFNKKGNVKDLLNEYLGEKEILNKGKYNFVCSQCGIMSTRLIEMKNIYMAPEVLILHFNNSAVLNDYLEIREYKREENAKIFELNSIILSKEKDNNEINYEVAIKENNIWSYYTNNGVSTLPFIDIINKGNICMAFYNLSSNEFSLFS